MWPGQRKRLETVEKSLMTARQTKWYPKSKFEIKFVYFFKQESKAFKPNLVI